MSMKDMADHQRVAIQAVKDELHVKGQAMGEVDLARRKRKAIVLSTEDRQC